MSPVRKWFRDLSTVVKLYATTVTAVLALGIAWTSVGLPTPAWSSDLEAVYQRIAGVEQLNLDTRALLLSDRWEQIFRELTWLESKDGLTAQEQERLIQLRINKHNTEKQQRVLEGG